MKAAIVIVFTICALLPLCTLVAGCICYGPGNEGPATTPTYQPTGIPSPAATPAPGLSASLGGWGTDRETYARNDTAIGWVYVTNTGNAPIDEIDFAIVIKRIVLFLPVEKTFSYNATGLDIGPGETKKVQFSQVIPAEYSGISTAGDYELVVTALLAGKEIESYSRNIRIV